MYIAHSANAEGKVHDLVEHLRSVAQRAGTFAAKFGCEPLAYWAGLCHDLGKFSTANQTYLSDPEHRHSPGRSRFGRAR
jgi:CRISPR-associated endonuclease/helicase Cas3